MYIDATPEVIAATLETVRNWLGDSESETTIAFSRPRGTLLIWSSYGPDIRDVLTRGASAILRLELTTYSVGFVLDANRWGGAGRVLTSVARTEASRRMAGNLHSPRSTGEEIKSAS